MRFPVERRATDGEAEDGQNKDVETWMSATVSCIAGVHFSLIRSAKLHKLDLFQYYVEVIEIIPCCQTADDYQVLLPWNIDLEKVAALD